MDKNIIKVVIFDADGVLINGARFSDCLEKEKGVSKELSLPFFMGPFNDCLIGDADLKETVKPYIESWGWEGDVDSFLDYWFKVEHSLDEDLIKYIQDLREKGVSCFVATNQEKNRAEYMLNKMDFANSFDGLYASAHLGFKKPNTMFFEKVFTEINKIKKIDKNEVIFWDDTPENVEGAKEFGIKAELYSSFEDFKKKMGAYSFE